MAYTSAQIVQAVTIPSGVLQVVSATTSTQITSSSTTAADTGLTATITPTSASNNILVVVQQNGGLKTSANASSGLTLRLLRGATIISTFAIDCGYTATALENHVGTIGTSYLDSPSTTSATTYKTTFANGVAAAAVRLQESGTTSTITLYEIKP